ncbi:ExbD/TolR family protein [Chromobacterium subtsugae]|uniref:ExbD/TolR family protein n=1 Tax=Chromobacterium subtsugae TaxID=251747 RepID=A0ABS7F7Y7_9NEIS|nr:MULTISPECIES: ExbD/TolR family protein [Chromobacterium]RBH41074.1 ExbD/TolR family protein [Pseudomonas sp. MWU13-2860]KUM01777.1 protein TolR [Chromobacterium subtsugae]KZE83260.1 protein TolR [Chromobacterium sp. F49]MBW7567227.1 ExbD/TolR family protein [Chromobacterium subtsugae]MBW8286197.1 ExbD/TolR family protein [Chromobacterium subtsugae]
MLNRRPRRQMNQMNVVPYIDVMLVLLVIFMVTAPMFTPGVIDVPSVSEAPAIDVRPIEVTVDATGKIELVDGEQKSRVDSLDDLASQLQALVGENPRPVAISADANLKYAEVVRIADRLHQAGVKRVALTVKQTPKQ